MKNKSSKQVIKSIRLPDKIWHYLKKNADKNYRSLNSQLLKIIEDWLVDHDFIENNGWVNSKINGKMRLEGKDYIVKDGDVLNFRFNT